MRLCPYCSAENPDLTLECRQCGRELSPLPLRGSGSGTEPEAPAGSGFAVSTPARGRRTAPLPPSTGPHRAFSSDDQHDVDAPRPEATPLTELEPGPEPETETSVFAVRLPEPTLAPPPTRLVAPAAGTEPQRLLPVVDPLPEPPESGFLPSARYTLSFLRGVWRRRAAMRNLNEQIRTDTSMLDGLLLAMGRTVRQLRLSNRSLAAENQAIDEAERRRSQAELDSDELARRLEEENQRFAEQELDRESKLSEAGAGLEKADKEFESLEAQRRALRDKRKILERQQRAYIKTADDREAEAARAADEENSAQLRRSAEDLRREATALDPERQDLDRRLGALDKPVSQAAARVEALRGEQESIRRALHDLREGHRQRLSEIEAEQGRKGRDVSTAGAEIARRLVTLGTLLNLNRIERPEFDELYARVDQLRSVIGACTQEIDRLTAERGSYDRGALARGIAALLLGLVALSTAAVLAAALL